MSTLARLWVLSWFGFYRGNHTGEMSRVQLLTFLGDAFSQQTPCSSGS